MPQVAALQMTSTSNIDQNLAQAEKLISEAAHRGAQLIVLPENFACMKQTGNELYIEKKGDGKIQQFLARLAKERNVYLVGGTFPLQAEYSNKPSAACLIFDPAGQLLAEYNKMHLFDVSVRGGETHHESANFQAGDEPVCVATAVGNVGVAICYDIRFPEFTRYLFNQGMELLAVPAAFTQVTGQAHWEVLLRARAIENFCYVVASAQAGMHENGRETFGHSMIINPWGEVIACLDSGVGIVTAEIDLDYLRKVRESIPVDRHQRLGVVLS